MECSGASSSQMGSPSETNDDVSSGDSLIEPLQSPVIVYRRRESGAADVAEESAREITVDGAELCVDESTADGPGSCVEETTANGPERSVEEKRVNLRKRGSEEVTEPAKICHNCRSRRSSFLFCSRCCLNYCNRCLKNRHGEDIQLERDEKVKWVCPKCRGGCGPGCLTNW
jgi:hypothetical protein